MRVPLVAKGGRFAVTITAATFLVFDAGIARVDAEALEHGFEALLQHRAVADGIARAVEAEDDAIAGQLVLAHALDVDDVLEARARKPQARSMAAVRECRTRVAGERAHGSQSTGDGNCPTVLAAAFFMPRLARQSATKPWAGFPAQKLCFKPPLTNWAKSAGQETPSRDDEGQFRLVHIGVRWQQAGPNPPPKAFSQLLAAAGVAAQSAPHSAVSAPPAYQAFRALLALQGVGGPEAAPAHLRKGRRLLDALDRLQLAILGEGPTRRPPRPRFKGALSEQREATGDFWSR